MFHQRKWYSKQGKLGIKQRLVLIQPSVIEWGCSEGIVVVRITIGLMGICSGIEPSSMAQFSVGGL